jgi:hypothetical protein
MTAEPLDLAGRCWPSWGAASEADDVLRGSANLGGGAPALVTVVSAVQCSGSERNSCDRVVSKEA